MSLLFACDDVPPAPWIKALQAELPDLDIDVWPDCSDPLAVEAALIWGPHASQMDKFPNLKAILSIGAGVDHILRAPGRPDGVPVVRLVDPGLRQGMIDYVTCHVARHHRDMPAYAEQQHKALWIERRQTLAHERRVGIMGLGSLGKACAEALVGLGFDVIGWSRSRKTIDGVGCFYGEDALHSFLAKTEILVCLLPLTPDTTDIMNHTTLSALPPGATLINVGRGEQLVEADLLALLETGQIAGATLDVFRTEPLPRDHAFWSHPNITVTPHIAAVTLARTAAPVIADTLRRLAKGRKLLNVVDPGRGY
ncbi:MAG: glyoxylate/hydroxypyruvate reductase A [Alphaproteobacteria bacterium]